MNNNLQQQQWYLVISLNAWFKNICVAFTFHNQDLSCLKCHDFTSFSCTLKISVGLHQMVGVCSWWTHFLSSRIVFGTLYPAYYSYKAVKSKDVKEYVSVLFAFYSWEIQFCKVLSRGTLPILHFRWNGWCTGSYLPYTLLWKCLRICFFVGKWPQIFNVVNLSCHMLHFVTGI